MDLCNIRAGDNFSNRWCKKVIKSAVLLVVLAFSSNILGVVVNEDGSPKQEVIELFKLFSEVLPQHEIKGILGFKTNPSLISLNKIAQENFLRPKNSERLSEKAKKHYGRLCENFTLAKYKKAIALFKLLGDIEDVCPENKSFDYILIQGSTIQNMRQRIMFLARTVKTSEIVLQANTGIFFFTGERKLFKSETKKVLLEPSPFPVRFGWQQPNKLPANERDAAIFVWDQLDLPPKLKKIKPIFVYATKKTNFHRAHTEDTVIKWIEEFKPKPGRCLIISNNPFVYYQILIHKLSFVKARTKGFHFEGLGEATDINKYPEKITLGILMDNLARVIYMETQYLKLAQSKS